MENLRHAAENPRRRAGLPWNEYGFLDVQGDAAAIGLWKRGHRALAYLLPSKLRKLVPLLVRDPGAPIEISADRALSPLRAERLQALCLRKLTADSPALSGAERRRLF